MSRPAPRRVTDHAAKARVLRGAPGEWLHIGSHRSPVGAQSAARRIDTGQIPAYRPEGAFESRTVADCDSDTTAVEARWLGHDTNTTTRTGGAL